MKLSDWAKKQGISYITAWRWFNEGKFPVKAYRSDSGTIIVQDESETSEQVMGNTQSNDVMSMVLKKTVEFSKNNGTVEDFAAWILSTFSLKLNVGTDSPKYSRVKPKPEEVQKHFQKFIKKDEKPKPNSFIASEETLDEIIRGDGLVNEEKFLASLEVSDNDFGSPDPELNKSFSEALLSNPILSANVTTYDTSTGGVITRSVDSTPQLNYTGSTFNVASSSNLPSSLSFNAAEPVDQYFGNTVKKSLVSSSVSAEKLPQRARRGRKPAKLFGK